MLKRSLTQKQTYWGYKDSCRKVIRKMNKYSLKEFERKRLKIWKANDWNWERKAMTGKKTLE